MYLSRLTSYKTILTLEVWGTFRTDVLHADAINGKVLSSKETINKVEGRLYAQSTDTRGFLPALALSLRQLLFVTLN